MKKTISQNKNNLNSNKSSNSLYNNNNHKMIKALPLKIGSMIYFFIDSCTQIKYIYNNF